MKMSFTKLRLIGISVFLILLLSIILANLSFIYKLKANLVQHEKVMQVKDRIARQGVDVITAGFILYQSIYEHKTANIEKALDMLHTSAIKDPSLSPVLEQISNTFTDFKKKMSTILHYYQANVHQNDPTMDFAKQAQQQALKLTEQVVVNIHHSFIGLNAVAFQLQNNLKSDIQYIRNTTVIFLSLLILIMLVMAWLFNNQLEDYFKRIRMITEHMSQGDYSDKLEVIGRDNVAHLNMAINQMGENIQVLLGQEHQCTIDAQKIASSEKEKSIALKAALKEQEKKEQEVLRLTRHDFITDLPNRLQVNEYLDKEISRSTRFQRQLAIMILNLDNFKTINEAYGREIGDAILRNVADRLKNCIRKEDFCGRLESDEFSIIILDTKSVEEVGIVANKILECFHEPFNIEAYSITLTASVGIALYPFNGDSTSTLFENADHALYQAKQAGKNGYRFSEDEFNEMFKRKMELGYEMQYAIDRNQFFLMYQPIMDLCALKIVGVEALLRWKHPEKGFIGPEEFIPIAESTGFIINIGNWVNQTVYTQLQRWAQVTQKEFFITINISPLQLLNTQSTQILLDILKHSNKGKQHKIHISIELTESDIATNIDKIAPVLKVMSSYAHRILVDDFGTGQSSLSRLSELSVDTLKIDKSLVMDLPKNEAHLKIVKTILLLADSLSLDVIAEGIETEEQLDFLIKNKCPKGQGYYFSKPVVAETVTKLIKEKEILNEE